MKVLYDHQIFTNQIYGGVSRYFYELMNHFSQNQDIKLEISLKYSNNHYLENVNFTKHKTFFKYVNFKGKSHIMTSINEFHSKRLLIKHDFDVFHPTYYNPYFLKYIDKKPFVVTVHDMIHELYPDQFIGSGAFIKAKKKSINTADIIICVSENTKKDLMNMYDVPEDKIKVIYHGNSLPKSDEYLKCADLKKMYSITKPFLLYVGDRKRSYKNFAMLLETYLTMLSDRFDLVCFGGGDFNHNELKTIENIRCSGKVIHLSGSDHLLASLYKNAFCFIYPSLYEGFGIPLLEAMGLGCPVIASNTSSIPEVVDKAALFFDPNSIDNLINLIELLESNESKREKLVNHGFEQEKKFSWDKTAHETFKVYKYAYDLKH